MAEKKSPTKAKSKTSKTSTTKSKTSSTAKPKDPLKAVQKEIKKDIKKTAKKHPWVVVVIILVVIALVAGVFAFLYFGGYFDNPTIKLINGDTIVLNIGEAYHEDGIEFYIKNKVVDPSEYTYTVEYYQKGPDGKFETADDIKVSTIDTSADGIYIAKYTVTYNGKTYNATKKINVGVEAMSITMLALNNEYNGDCTYIKAGDVDILIDAGSRPNSSNAIYDYITTHGCTDNKLEYVIVTHAHQDHYAGFIGTKASPSLLERFEVETLIQFSRSNNVGKSQYESYVQKVNAAKEKGTTVVTALDCWNNENGGHREYEIANGITMKILHQEYYEKDAKGNENLYSVCTLFEHGSNNYLFTGDLEHEAVKDCRGGEQSLIEDNDLPEVEFFKAGHHGSGTANSDALLSVIKPKNIGINCVAGAPEFTKTNNNTMPYQVTTNTMSKYTDNIFCTKVGKNIDLENESWEAELMNGNITFYSENGKDYTFTGDNNNIKLKDSAWFKANRTWPTI